MTLERLPEGATARVVAVPSGDADRLASEGLRPGDVLLVEARLPLGGPVVVRLGRARVALARRVAGAIVVQAGGA
jgi:Fe2+ transport system protein FeoA